jgi:hypothetical protein
MTIYNTIRNTLAGLALLTIGGCATTGSYTPTQPKPTTDYTIPLSSETDGLSARIKQNAERRKAAEAKRQANLECANSAFSELEKKLTVKGSTPAEKLVHLAQRSGRKLDGDYIKHDSKKEGKFKVQYSGSWDSSLTIEVTDADPAVKKATIVYSVRNGYYSQTAKIRRLKQVTFTGKDGRELFRYDGRGKDAAAENYAATITAQVWDSAIKPIESTHKKCTTRRAKDRKNIESTFGVKPAQKKVETPPQAKPDKGIDRKPSAPAHKLPFYQNPVFKNSKGKKIQI